MAMEALMEDEESEGSDVLDSHESDVADGPDVADSDADAWDSEGSEGAGWLADPDVEGQERYYDGSEWTSETRSAEAEAPVSHLPDHAGELQRALAAATGDIDDVEDRLGTLFDRAEQHGERGGRAREQVEAEAAESRGFADSGVQDRADSGVGYGGDDDDTLPDLDEDLASEEPEKVKKGLFRRRS
jgi:hypothetical protein